MQFDAARGTWDGDKIVSRYRWVAAGMLAVAGWPQVALAQVSWNLYDQYTKSYTINYVNTPAVTPGAKGALMVQLSVGDGTAANFEVDTGSAGAVVPIAMIPNFVPVGKPVKFGYASSGNYSTGTWSTQTITFPNSTDGSGNPATATVPVFVAQKYTIDGTTYDCAITPSSCAHMMGVGFGRPDAGQTGYQPSLDSNPLLHFAGMDEGTVRAGYVITPYGIQAGLTAQNAGSGFSYVQLQPAVGATAPNWQTTPGTVVVNGNAAVSTEVLIDTGINYMWSSLGGSPVTPAACPAGSSLPAGATCAAPGTTVSVFFGGTEGVGYTFTVDGTANPDATPEFVRLDAAGLNTGIHPISSFTYMFDAVGGFMGLKAVDPSQSGIAFAPYLSTMGDFDLPAGFGTNLEVYVRGGSTLSAAADALFTGAFTGPGALVFDGPGTVTLSGAMTLPAGITVSGGSAIFSGVVTAPLNVGTGASATNQNSVIGNVTNSGTFSNDGTVTGAFVNNGVLIGNGTVIGDLTNNAVISPGHSIGVVNVVGNLTFAPGSSYYVAEIDAGGVSDQIIVTGAVAINDATLYLVPLPTWVPTFGTYQFITAGGGATGTFNVVSPTLGSATSLYPFLDAITASNATGVSVEIVRSDVPFADVASTTNQIAVAGMLDDLPVSSPFLPLVTMLTGPQARAAFDGMSGEIYASVQGVLQQQSLYLRSTVNDRLRAAAGEVSATDLAAAPIAPGYSATVWMNGYGGWGSTGSTANSASLDRSSAGVIAGLDVPLSGAWNLGFAGGYGSSNIDVDALASSADIDSYDLAIYAGGKWGAFSLRGGAAYGWNAVSANRTVAFPGFVEGESGDYDANTTQIFGEVGYELAYGAARFEPFAGLAYVKVAADGFTEQGGVAALTTQGDDQDNTYSTLGLRVSADLPVAAGRLAMRGLLGWQHAFGDVTPGTAMDLAGEGGGFTITGAPIDENALLVGAGLDYLLNADLRLSLAYEGQIGSHANDNAVKASLSYQF